MRELDLLQIEPPPSAGKPCSRFAFAIADGVENKVRAKRRLAVVDYVLIWRENTAIVDEWEDGNNRWLVVEVAPKVGAEAAKKFATDCPHYVRGSFAVDRW